MGQNPCLNVLYTEIFELIKFLSFFFRQTWDTWNICESPSQCFVSRSSSLSDFEVYTSLWGHLCVLWEMLKREEEEEEALTVNSCWQLFVWNYLIHREVSELLKRTRKDIRDTDNTVDSQHHSEATMNHWGNQQMRTGWSNLMVIVVQDVGAGLMKSTEAYSFIKCHCRDDDSDNILVSLTTCTNIYFFISLSKRMVTVQGLKPAGALPFRLTKHLCRTVNHLDHLTMRHMPFNKTNVLIMTYFTHLKSYFFIKRWFLIYWTIQSQVNQDKFSKDKVLSLKSIETCHATSCLKQGRAEPFRGERAQS